MTAFKKILVPIDFGDPSKHAIEVGAELAKREGGSLTLLHVWELPAYAYAGMEYAATDLLTPFQTAARASLDATVRETQKTIANADGVLKQGVPWREILATIEETHPDLVVIGTHGRRGASRVLLGSVAEKVVRTSPVPVLTVRER